LDRGFEVGGGPLEVVKHQFGMSTIDQRPGVLGVEFDRLGEIGDRSRKIPGGELRDGSIAKENARFG
jgi:hypothetical protein